MANVWRVTTRGKIFEQVCENVLHFWESGILSADGVMAIVRDTWFPTVRAIQNANFVWFQILTQQIVGPVAPGPIEVWTFPNQPGSLSGAGAHPSLAAKFTTRASCAGRNCRGRIYLPGVHGESVANGVVQVGALAAYVQVAGLLKDRFTVNGASETGLRLVVLPRAAPAQFKFITQIIARPTFGIQRRRNVGVGS